MKKDKYSCFQSEYDNLCQVAEKLKLKKLSWDDRTRSVKYARHPLAYLVEAADDICYRVLDIEDAITLGLIDAEDMIGAFHESLDLSEEQKSLLRDKDPTRRRLKIGIIRGNVIGKIIEEAITIFTEAKNYAEIMQGTFEESLLDRSKEGSLWSIMMNLYKNKSLKDKIYTNPNNVLLELGVYNFMETVFGAMLNAAKELSMGIPESSKTKIVLKILEDSDIRGFKSRSLYGNIMMILDYVASMTDRYAVSINKQYLGLGP